MFHPGFLGAPESGGNDVFTKILLHMEGAEGGTVFTDDNAGGSAHTWTSVGTGGCDTTIFRTKFGARSMRAHLIDGGAITTPDHADFTLGSGNWTVDCWFNRYTVTGERAFFGKQTIGDVTTGIGARFDSDNRIRVYIGIPLAVFTSANTFTGDTWRHVALVRNGGTITLYVDGAVEATHAVGASSIAANAAPFGIGRIGANTSNSSDFQGFIDEFRLSVGVPRWTAPFTPPTVAYF